MEGGNQRAKKNWGKLKDIIRSGAQAKKKKQYKFALFEKHIHNQQQILNTHYVLEEIHLLQRTPVPTVNQLLHFDSPIDATGKWVWEAEEVAAYYLLRQVETYILELVQQSQNIRILELGAGSSGLASIALKIAAQKLGLSPVFIEITDGETQNIVFLDQNLKINDISAQEGRARHMIWGDKQAVQNLTLNYNKKAYEIVIVCDCLFFQQFHKQLLLSIESYLHKSGLALLVNPSRGNSLNNFLELAKNQNFQSRQIDFQDQLYKTEVQRLRKSQNFREDTDIPHIIELRRGTKHNQK